VGYRAFGTDAAVEWALLGQLWLRHGRVV